MGAVYFLLSVIILLQIINHFKSKNMADVLDEITTEVSEAATVMASAIVLIKSIKTKLDEAGTNPAKLKALSTSLDTNANALAAAITENTPSEEPPVEPPVE